MNFLIVFFLEFLLLVSDDAAFTGTVLVAPILNEGETQREVVLPSGTWTDGNNNTKTFSGPTKTTYHADLTKFPYFIKTA